jgi:hypothetical protein
MFRTLYAVAGEQPVSESNADHAACLSALTYDDRRQLEEIAQDIERIERKAILQIGRSGGLSRIVGISRKLEGSGKRSVVNLARDVLPRVGDSFFRLQVLLRQQPPRLSGINLSDCTRCAPIFAARACFQISVDNVLEPEIYGGHGAPRRIASS